MAEFTKGDRVRVEGYGEGEVIDADSSRTQVYKKNRTDKSRTVQVVTVQLDGEQMPRGFPVDVLEKI